MKSSRSIVVAIVAVLAVGFFVWLTNSYVLRSNAAQKKVDITITSTATGTSSTAPINILVDPEDDADLVSGADVYFDVTNGEISSWEGCSNVDGSSTTFTELITKTGKGARYSCVVLKEAKELPKAISIKGVATCSTKNPMHIKVLKDKTDVVGPVEGAEYALETVTEFDYACGGETKPAPTEDMITSFSPESCSTDVGGDCEFTLKTSSRTGNDRISAMYFKLSYDKNILRAVSVNNDTKGRSVQGATTSQNLLAQTSTTGAACKVDTDCPSVCANPAACTTIGACDVPAGSTTGTCVYKTTGGTPGTPGTPATPSPSTNTGTTPAVSLTPIISLIPSVGPSGIPPLNKDCWLEVVDLTPGELGFLYTCKQKTADLPTSISLPIKFDAIGNGDGDVRISAVQIAGPDIVGAYSVHKSRAEYSVGGGTPGNLKLNMKLRLQCILNKPRGSQTVKVRVGLGDGKLKNTMFETGEFKVDDKGIWKGTVTFKAPAGSGYKIKPKADMHMQKGVCVNNPTEDYPGAYRCDKGEITLKDGDNDIDFSKIAMLSGDLPPGDQDGISNAKDMSLLRSLLGKNDSESVKLGDINHDGVINAVEPACLIGALSIHWDEE